jgi:putative ABC transport system ATP-binding protein
MQIHCKQLVPRFLSENTIRQSQVWGEDIMFKSSNYYQITGISGIGKTTFISLLFGIRNNYKGALLFDQQLVSSLSLKNWLHLRQQKLSVVFQGLNLFQELTGWQNILVKNRLTKSKKKNQIVEMAEELGIENILKRKVLTYSFGQKQRIAIIRALCQPFSFILLDEPFGHLDEEMKGKALSLIMREADSQKAGIMITSLANELPFKTILI